MPECGIERLQRVLELYAHGAYTALEVWAVFIEHVAPNNLGTLMKMLPPDVVRIVRESIVGAPCTDEAWNRLRLVEISGVHPGRSELPNEGELEQRKRDFRRKVELIRGFLDVSGSDQ